MAYTCALYHFVFRTKNSVKAFELGKMTELFKYMTGVCGHLKCKTIWINGMTDHIHLAVGMAPDVSPAKLMQEVKRASSIWLTGKRETYPKFNGWATGYFAATFSYRDMENVVNYIKHQQEHHTAATLHEEMNFFFRITGLEEKLDYFFSD